MRFLEPFNGLIWPPVAILDFTLYRELPELLREAGEPILLTLKYHNQPSNFGSQRLVT